MTRRDKLRLGVNLSIRFACFGYLTWWFVTHLDRVPVWGVALYALADLAMLFTPLLVVVGWVYLRWHGQEL